MKRTSFAPMLAAAAFALGGCAAQSPQAAPPPQAAGLTGAPARVVEAPAPGTSATGGAMREVRVLVDEPALKLVAIVLRQGTLLPEHRSLVPVTIQALQGAGTVIAGSERFRIEQRGVVVLAANVPHSVQPDAGVDMVLLVHHLGRGKETH